MLRRIVWTLLEGIDDVPISIGILPALLAAQLLLQCRRLPEERMPIGRYPVHPVDDPTRHRIVAEGGCIGQRELQLGLYRVIQLFREIFADYLAIDCVGRYFDGSVGVLRRLETA